MNVRKGLLSVREMTKLYVICPEDKRSMVHDAIINKLEEMLDYTRDNQILTTEEPKSTLNPDGVSKKCECGARHTAFPNAHMNYCPLKKWK